MVDSVNGSAPISTLLRAQNSTLTAINTAQQAQQKLIDQLANGAKPTTVQPAGKSAGASKAANLPRGSLVDVFA